MASTHSHNSEELKAIHELDQGTLTIRANESESDDLIKVTMVLSFTRYSDGKLFELELLDDQIQKLHQIFFDTSLILDILELKPTFLRIISDQSGNQVIENIPGGVQNTRMEILDIVWEFTQGSPKKSRLIPVSIKIPEKQYPEGSNQQLIEFGRLLNCYKQRIIELESLLTERYRAEGGYGGNQFVPKNNHKHEPDVDDMIWLSSSAYGAMTGLNKYFLQFRNIDDMTKIADTLNNYDGVHYMIGKHIRNWLQQNKLEFNEIRSAEYCLNKFTDDKGLELLNVRSHNTNKIDIVSEYEIDRSRLSKLRMITTDVLHGYFRKANPRKQMIYIIAKCTDPAPTVYEAVIYLRDAYKHTKNCVEEYPLISEVCEKNKELVAYNSQWVIYKICAKYMV
jgi:hypothetical protein